MHLSDVIEVLQNIQHVNSVRTSAPWMLHTGRWNGRCTMGDETPRPRLRREGRHAEAAGRLSHRAGWRRQSRASPRGLHRQRPWLSLSTQDVIWTWARSKREPFVNKKRSLEIRFVRLLATKRTTAPVNVTLSLASNAMLSLPFCFTLSRDTFRFVSR